MKAIVELFIHALSNDYTTWAALASPHFTQKPLKAHMPRTFAPFGHALLPRPAVGSICRPNNEHVLA